MNKEFKMLKYIVVLAVILPCHSATAGFDVLNLKDYGAIPDDGLDDAPAIDAFITDWIAKQKTAFVPKGRYIYRGRLLIDLDRAKGRTLPPLFGEGAYLSKIVVETEVAPAIHFYASKSFDHFFLTLRDIGFQTDKTLISMAVGRSDFKDSVGNCNFENVYVGNSNSTNLNATVLQLNYLFNCKFENVVAVGKPGHGTALQLRQARFCSFVGGSFSNSGIGIYMSDGVINSNTFISPDIENVGTGVLVNSSSAEANTLINPFFDIFNPLDPPNSTGYAIKSTAIGPKGLIVDNPYLAERPQSQVLHPSDNDRIIVRGN